MLPQKLAFVDIETTGTRLRYDRIIDIGIIRVENGSVTEEFSSLVDPGIYLPPEITRLTGISQQDLDRAPSFTQIKDRIIELLKDSFFVAHNVQFDYRFLKTEFSRAGISFKAKRLCTVKLSRYLYKEHERHNLDSITRRFNIEPESRHRGFGDARILWNFYQKIVETQPEEQVAQAIEKALGKPNLPSTLSERTLDDLPESSGVYIFYGTNQAPLYIGKSKSLRKRVFSHFSLNNTSPTGFRISSQITGIETIKTAGELGALLKESKLIKQMQPLYNRKLRYSRSLILLKLAKKDGYFIPEMEDVETIDWRDLPKILGIFRSRKQAIEFLIEKVAAHRLCDKLMGIEKTKRGCFGYSMGRCRGACLGLESPVRYNIRFTEAFAKHKMQSWPFPGPVMIREYDEEAGLEEVHVVDQWCYLGSLEGNGSNIQNQLKFDLDIYKILCNFLHNPKNLKLVQDARPLVQSANFLPDSL